MPNGEKKVAKIAAIKELEPAIYEVAVVYADGSTATLRMTVFELNALKAQLGLPFEA